MNHWPKFSLDLIARTSDPAEYPAVGVQYCVVDDDGGRHVYGDQMWVPSGACIRDGSFPGGRIERREVTISYGEWREVAR